MKTVHIALALFSVGVTAACWKPNDAPPPRTAEQAPQEPTPPERTTRPVPPPNLPSPGSKETVPLDHPTPGPADATPPSSWSAPISIGGGPPSDSLHRSTSEADADRALAESIRASLVRDPVLSGSARSVAISVVSGKVWLRGKVNSLAEKEAVEAKARDVSGVTEVTSRLQVKK